MVKGVKAKGKRVANYTIDRVEELEPLRQPEKPNNDDGGDNGGDDGNDGNDNGGGAEEDLDPDAGKSQQQVIDEMTGQLNLFDQ